MGLFANLAGLFSGGSHEFRLKKALELAKGGKPEAAIEIYDDLLARSTDEDLKARAMLNRALAYSALSDDGQAERDLKSVLANNQSSEAVKPTAREKLARVQKRMLRSQDRTRFRV